MKTRHCIDLSIIVPVYNVENYIRNCIDSILNQTYKNFELILIDDGSKDSSGEICEEYAKLNSNIRVVHQENKGQSAARNLGVKLSKSEWILFVDSDDLIHPQMVEFLVRAVELNHVDMSVCCRIQSHVVPGGFYDERYYSNEVIEINEKTLMELYTSKSNVYENIYWLVYPKLIKKSIYERYPLIEGRIFEDNEVCCKWLVASSRIVLVPETMYFYTHNPNSTMNSAFSIKHLDYLWALESMVTFYKEINYERMLKLVANDYFPTAVYLCKEASNILKNRRLCKKMMRDVEEKYKLYTTYTDIVLSDSVKNYILSVAHPIRYKINKKIRNLFSYIKMKLNM